MNENELLKYFDGTITPQDFKEVETWINQSEENKKIAEEVYRVYYMTQTFHIMQKINVSKDFAIVAGKIKKHNRKLFIYKLQRIAAVMTIPLLCITMYLLTKPNGVEYRELRTNPGMITSFKLPDSSEVWLNSSSFIRYPIQFKGNKRKVYLEGEAYFNISKDKKKKFVVETSSNAKVEVLGTEFNLEAYPKDDEVTTTLVSGSVVMKYTSVDNKIISEVIEPGEKVSYNSKRCSSKKVQTPVSVAVAWKDSKVILRKTPIDEMIKILSKRFDVDFLILNNELRNGVYSGTFDNQLLPDILESLKLSTGIRYRINNPYTDNNGNKVRTQVELF